MGDLQLCGMTNLALGGIRAPRNVASGPRQKQDLHKNIAFDQPRYLPIFKLGPIHCRIARLVGHVATTIDADMPADVSDDRFCYPSEHRREWRKLAD